MKTIKDFHSTQLAVNELFEFKHRLETQNFDLGGRRFTNVGGALDKNEYCTLYQLEQIRDSLLAIIEQKSNKIAQLEYKLSNLDSQIP